MNSNLQWNSKNSVEVPASACVFVGGEVVIGDNGENAKTAPVRLKARSGQPIDHHFWGRVVHDINGMRTSKTRISIDYAHNDDEVLGYANHFENVDGDLILSGALVPFTSTDRASEVLHKMKAGVPYESSIFFGGDGLKLEEVMDGESVSVNGYEFAGPGVVIREWGLRGVAICPYGYDQNTESTALSSGDKVVATQWKNEKQEENKMSEVVETVEAEAAVEVEETVETPAVEAEVEETENAELSEESVEDVEPDQVEPAGAELEATNAALTQAIADKQEAEAKLAEANEELAKALAEKEETLAAYAADKIKLAAYELGQAPLSAVADEENKNRSLSLMERARLNGSK